jgi:hypothetical protein
MPVVELFECAHVLTKKPLHQCRVRRLAFAIPSSDGREEEHVLEVCVSCQIYGWERKLDEFTAA